MIGLVAVVALAALPGCTVRSPARYFVAPVGSDRNSGETPASPFATLQRALDEAASGSVITLARGVYYQDAVTRRGRVAITGPPDAVVKGAGASRILQVRHDDITLEGFTVDGLAGRPEFADGYRDKLIYVMSARRGHGVAGLRIRNMTIRNAGGECVRLRYLVHGAEVSGNTIGPCGVYAFRFSGGGKNGEGIYLGTVPRQQGDRGAPDDRRDVSHDNRVVANRIDTQGAECVDIKENATANLVQANLCTGQRDPASAGFAVAGNGNTLSDNIARDNVGAGIRLSGPDNSVLDNELLRNRAGGIKFLQPDQRVICGNRTEGNGGGDAVGLYGDRFAPAARCEGPGSAVAVSARPQADD